VRCGGTPGVANTRDRPSSLAPINATASPRCTLARGMGADTYEPSEYWERAARSPGEVFRPVLHVDAPAWFNEIIDTVQWNALLAVFDVLAAKQPALEIGCGVGRWQARLQGIARSIGVDFSMAMLQSARRTGAQHLVLADARRLPFKEASVGSALSVTVVQHVLPGDQEDVLRQLHFAVRPQGLLCLLERIGSRGDAHVFPHTPQKWISLAAAAGWRLTEWRGVEFLFLPRIVSATARTARALAFGPPRGRDPDRVKPTAFYSRAKDLHMSLLKRAAALSLSMEPVIERFAPPGWATHGLFLFERC
jgi:SAM-dependent methyltransferase